MTWDPPAGLEEAEKELQGMHRLGVEAVRTGLILEPRLLSLADTLGLHLYQELPLDDLPALLLADTLAHALSLITRAIGAATDHPSARNFGLARRVDTSDPRACTFFDQLTRKVHQLPGAQAYYVTAFIESDVCARMVDFVLLDARDAANPLQLLARWGVRHPVSPSQQIGIAALGTWVQVDAMSGLHTPHTPEFQARYLETHLGSLFSETAPLLRVVFVYRWRDAPVSSPILTYDVDNPYQLAFGLHTQYGAPRPSKEVVRGIYTETQTVFAFPTGQTPLAEIPWSLLTGWLVLCLLGINYALSPRFRYMVPRYFFAHTFYRDAIREGREVLLGTSILLMGTQALSVGVLTSVLCQTFRTQPAFAFLVSILPDTLQYLLTSLMAQPWMLILLPASLYALSASLWTSLLSFVSRRRRPMIPGQALMLVLWTRWMYFPLMIGAMLVPNLPASWQLPLVLVLMGIWPLVTFFAIVKTLIDYILITRMSFFLILLLVLLNPMVLFLTANLLLMMDLEPYLNFAWHLATRS